MACQIVEMQAFDLLISGHEEYVHRSQAGNPWAVDSVW